MPDNYVSANVGFFLHPINMQFRKIRKIPFENFQRRYNLSTIILIIVLKGFAKYLIEIVFPIGEKYFLQETSRKFDSDK